MLQRLLATFGRIEGVQAAAVVDVDMNEIATFLTPDLKDVDVSNGLENILREAGRVATASGIEKPEQIWMESDDGNSIIAPLSGGFSLYVSSREGSNIGRLRHEIRVRAPVIEDLMR